MHRPLIYPYEQPRSTDFLFGMQQAMVGLGQLAQAVLGSSTLVTGLACEPTTPASLSVTVGAGQIYSQEPLEASQYGILPADTTDVIVKQGIMLQPQTLTFIAPTTAGYSINYLIEASYQDQDSDPVVLPYYNSANPSQPLSGQNNTGAAQPTERLGTLVLTAKAGAAATTGSQTTPTVDAGYVGLYVVTVANGQTQITSANITQVAGAPMVSNLLQMLQTGSPVNGTDTGAANAYAMALTPAPAAITPGMLVGIRGIVAANSGASTFNLNGLGVLPIQGPGAAALQGGEFVTGGSAILQANAGAAAWNLIWTGGAQPVATASQSRQAVNLSQLLQIIGRNNQAVINASTTLTAANAGQIITFTGNSAATITLPSSNAAPAGLLPLIINNASTYPLTVALPAGNTGGLGVNVLQAGQKAALWNDGASAWIELWNEAGSISPVVIGNATASNQAVALGQFIESHGSAGDEKLPGGRIRQWLIGTASAANTNQTMSLPIAFTTAIDSVMASSTSVGTFATATTNGTLSSVSASASNAGGSFIVFVEGY